ncbi:metallophosphoesterase [Paraglaciecola hydrolytica]|uniref:Calcineurin-like phosphoesterase domain-containing protein n=1 Tax=Paraglaciecola hydrolytica TaxID=1799789 RepID=A0A136A5Z2_9ALTE|nr:metallophosphoesterase [Paraglaciecola hydrolytica]KXI30631.1 hypothetical protein AX660_04110 [Paraglaciecola hydrolytica]
MQIKQTHLKRPQIDELRIGIIGDLHTYWDDTDLRQFSAADYDLLFFTGDLGDAMAGSSLKVAKQISKLSCPTLVMPGNNDTHDMSALAAEFALQNGLSLLADIELGDGSHHETLTLVGYSNHRVTTRLLDITFIAARPHSMGGNNLAFAERLTANFGIHDLEQSSKLLKQQVDACHTQEIIFLGHNGPLGLGSEPAAMWGCDFKPDGGDWGDPDLAEAIAYALTQGKNVLGVFAGHMHLRTKGGLHRPWQTQQQGIMYVNAAKVPRIFAGVDASYRHHIQCTISLDGISVSECHLPEYE